MNFFLSIKLYISIFLFTFSFFSFSQRIISQEYYEGKINNKIEVSLYLKIDENDCPMINAYGMYKYKSPKDSRWILLDVFFTEGKNQYTFVEHYNTGILLLKKENGTLIGWWISPDGKKQYQVELKKIKVSTSDIEHLENALENKQYEAGDC